MPLAQQVPSQRRKVSTIPAVLSRLLRVGALIDQGIRCDVFHATRSLTE